MTYQEYLERKSELKQQLTALEEEFIQSGEFHKGDIVVDSKGNEYIVRSMKISFGKVEINEISKKKKNGEWSEVLVSRYCAIGGLKKKE